MIVQFFNYGNGLSKGPLNYFLGKKRDRKHAQVLQGDVAEVAGLIDTSPYEKKYTSGCLSFYEDDLSDEHKKQIMQDFEKCLFPGMDQSQYRILWIEHKDKLNEETGEQRLELNFLIPNVEIITGKRLQPYYHPADCSRVDLFKKITNYEYQLHDADDPLYRQAVTSAKNLPNSVNEIKETIDIEATRAIENGLVTDRISMKNWLSDLGLEITRETNKSISIKNPNDDEKARPIRLTGAIYEQDFRLTETSQELTITASERYRQDARQRNKSNLLRYKKYSTKRREGLEQQYRNNEKEYTEKAERSNSRDITTATSELAGIEQLKPRYSFISEAKENTDYIEYSFDLISMYNAYQQYLFRLRQQQQVQRHQSNAKQSRLSKITGREHDDNELWGKTVRGVGPDSERDLRIGKWNETAWGSEGGTLNESRSTVITDHQRTTATIERTATKARRSISDYEVAKSNDQRSRDLLRRIDTTLQSYEERENRAEEYNTKTTESEVIRAFITKLGEQLKTTITEPFRAVSNWVKSKERDQRTITSNDLYRNREADSTTNATASRETGLSRELSRKTTKFNQTDLFTALDILENRRIEFRRKQEQERTNSSGYTQN
jgi:hypothetical protein